MHQNSQNLKIIETFFSSFLKFPSLETKKLEVSRKVQKYRYKSIEASKKYRCFLVGSSSRVSILLKSIDTFCKTRREKSRKQKFLDAESIDAKIMLETRLDSARSLPMYSLNIPQPGEKQTFSFFLIKIMLEKDITLFDVYYPSTWTKVYSTHSIRIS